MKIKRGDRVKVFATTFLPGRPAVINGEVLEVVEATPDGKVVWVKVELPEGQKWALRVEESELDVLRN